ncbi:MAG TPA: ABC transporter ATP-binding protein [Bacillota bacterium]|nr:ABC transporter ATP-binding protein [Bacillota bacterium]
MMLGGGKPKDMRRAIAKIAAYVRRYLPQIYLAVILALAGSIFTILGPDILKRITNLIGAGLQSGIDLVEITRISRVLAVLYGFSAIFSYIQGYIMATVTQRVSLSLRAEISQKINRLPLKYFDHTTFGDVLSRVTNDVDMVAQTLNQSVATLVSATTLFLGSLFMMLITSVAMTVTAVISSLLGFALMMLMITKSQKHFVRQQRELGALNGHIEETYSGHNVVRVYNAEAEAKAKFASINDELFDSAWRSQFLSGLMQPLMMFVGNLGYVAVSVIGATLVMRGSITFGVIVAFMVYVRLFTQPLTQIAQAATSLQSAAAAGERVFDFLDEEELTDESAKTQRLDSVKGHVEFDGVRFGYLPDKEIIHNFSAVALPGQKVAIVGPTGAGKTTMVNLLMRFYELHDGEIRVDGVPLQDIRRENVHELFGMVLQDTWLFEGTIRDNLAYSTPGVTQEDVVKACRAIGIDRLIRTLPSGYDTVLDDATSLSAGEKQLLTIARAVIEDAPLLILDEATSSVDTRTEILIQNAMDKLMAGRTSFIIAHRLSTIKNADLILVMNEGDIVESGNHEELLARNGFYAELYNSQFEEASN